MTVQDDLKTVRACSQTVAATVLGFKSAGSLRNMPDAPRARDGSYDLTKLVPWYVALQVAKTGDADPELTGPATPSLERVRRARAVEIETKLAREMGLTVNFGAFKLFLNIRNIL